MPARRVSHRQNQRDRIGREDGHHCVVFDLRFYDLQSGVGVIGILAAASRVHCGQVGGEHFPIYMRPHPEIKLDCPFCETETTIIRDLPADKTVADLRPSTQMLTFRSSQTTCDHLATRNAPLQLVKAPVGFRL